MTKSYTIVGACLHLLGMVVIAFGLVIADANPDNPNYTVLFIGLATYGVGALIRGFFNTVFILPIATGILILLLILFFGVPFWIAAYLFHVSEVQDIANILSSIAFVISVVISPLIGVIFYSVELFRDPGGNEIEDHQRFLLKGILYLRSLCKIIIRARKKLIKQKGDSKIEFVADRVSEEFYEEPLKQKLNKVKVWDELLKREPSNDEIFEIIRAAPEEYKAKAWEKFLKREPGNYELFLVIEKSPEEYKAKAWKEFMKQNPDSHDLNLVIAFASEKYSKKAQEVLNKIIYTKG